MSGFCTSRSVSSSSLVFLILWSAAVSGLYVADKETGELLQSFDPGQGATAPPLAVGSSVYLLSNAGAFFALRRG
jgi:hypothetical protein